MQFGIVTENKSHKNQKTKNCSEPSYVTLTTISKTVQLTENQEIVSGSSPFTEPFVHFHFRSEVHDGELREQKTTARRPSLFCLFAKLV